MAESASYLHVQNIALQVLRDVRPFIKAGITECEIALECVRLLEEFGARECWYYDVPALVLVGERTTLSASGREYQPSDLSVRNNDLVTIDLSPMVGGCWGDCARSYIVGSGKVATISKSSSLEDGITTERELHRLMRDIATPEMTMHELYRSMTQIIEDKGYKNLDFRGNLGHSIENHLDDRRYIEAQNHATLGEFDLFTFEPHICQTNDIWGFKMENIYHFEGGRAVPLGSPQLLEAVS